MVPHVAFVQPEGKFIDVAGKMLLAGVVINSDQAALKNGEHGLNRVSRHAVLNVFALAVIDRRVIEKQSAHSGVGQMLIGMQCRSDFDILHNHVLDRLRIGSLDLEALGATAFAAFLHAEYGGLAASAAADVQLFGFVLVRLDTAHVGFVDFDNALQLGHIAAASLSNAVQHKPCGTLADAYLFRQL